ncbi:DivIVA domain-containing protein [Anaerovibrio slackiae]|uniref:DivIVA domain-containing protein n=1 Tax=Anaerovibrio slackiae TaxID=2652309 RepID=UPI00386C9A08
MLTPVDIHNKEFSRSFRGFNQEEVDDFLDQVVNDYEMLYRDNHQMKKEIELCNKQLDQYHQLEKNLQDTLLVAQRTADEVVNTANVRGEEVRQAARQAGENLKREAELYAEKLKQDTERECKRKIEAAAAQVRAAVAEYERIVRERRQFVAKMRNLMQTELGLLEEAYDIMPDKVQERAGKAANESVPASAEQEKEAENVQADAEKKQEPEGIHASAASVAIAAQIGVTDKTVPVERV